MINFRSNYDSGFIINDQSQWPCFCEDNITEGSLAMMYLTEGKSMNKL